jgi:membrane fusion protein (multidrug efflux system)
MIQLNVADVANRRTAIRSIVVIGAVIAAAVALAFWKQSAMAGSNAAAASMPEPMESVAAAVAQEREHHRTTTSIGTIVALRSVTLRNEVPGTVSQVHLAPGQIVEAGTVLVALDTSVERAELKALEAQAALAETRAGRLRRMNEQRAASDDELDTAIAERDVALAQVARTRAIIARKTIRAPFRARVGISDVHRGQYLSEGTQLTTLQGVDEAAYVDFTVAQQVAAFLRKGTPVQVYARAEGKPVTAQIVATDSRVDPATRNAVVRARIDDADVAPAPGASVRVDVPVSAPQLAVTIPASALRKGPAGDHVFVLAEDETGKTRAHVRTVEVEALAGDEVVIRRGLKAGERVAASGSFKLREAALVAVTNGTEAVADSQERPAPAVATGG